MTEWWSGWKLYTRWSPSGKAWIYFYTDKIGYTVANKKSGHITVIRNGSEHPHPLPAWITMA